MGTHGRGGGDRGSSHCAVPLWVFFLCLVPYGVLVPVPVVTVALVAEASDCWAISFVCLPPPPCTIGREPRFLRRLHIAFRRQARVLNFSLLSCALFYVCLSL